MISAFGVDHGGVVAKSYLGGGKWKVASKLTTAERSQITSTRPNLWSRGVSASDKQFVEGQKSLHNVIGGSHKQVQVGRAGALDTSAAVTIRVGGKKTGKSFVFGQTAPQHRKKILTHEAQHAKVKRSSYRLHGQIGRDPQKLLREEARADIQSGKHYSRVPQSRRSAYEEIASLQRRAVKAPNGVHPLLREQARAAGVKAPRNKEAFPHQVENFKNAMSQAIGPHYAQGDTGAAVRGYRKIQDKIYRAKMTPAQKKAKLRRAK